MGNTSTDALFFFLFSIVTIQQDPFPVLTPPSVPTAVTIPPQSTGNIVHPPTQSMKAIYLLLF